MNGSSKTGSSKIPPDVESSLHQGVLLWRNKIIRTFKCCCQKSRSCYQREKTSRNRQNAFGFKDVVKGLLLHKRRRQRKPKSSRSPRAERENHTGRCAVRAGIWNPAFGGCLLENQWDARPIHPLLSPQTHPAKGRKSAADAMSFRLSSQKLYHFRSPFSLFPHGLFSSAMVEWCEIMDLIQPEAIHFEDRCFGRRLRRPDVG